MHRGDTNIITFKIKSNGVYIDGSAYSEVEVQFNPQSILNSVKKLKSKNEVAWNTDHFECALTQADTFNLSVGTNEMQVRLFNEGVCKATVIASINVKETLSQEVLQ